MEREQFVELMDYLLHEYINKSRRFRRYHPMEVPRLMDLISEMSGGYIMSSRHQRKTHPEITLQYLSAVKNTLNLSTDIAEDIGMLELLEEYEAIIIQGMEFNDLPQEDIEAMRTLGANNPRGALLACFQKVKTKGSISERENKNEVGIHKSLRLIEERIQRIENSIRDVRDSKSSEDDSRPSRRWFKGLGKIAQGSALTLADVCLAASILVLPVDPSTQTWGSIISSITGVGTALDGMGELRGE